MELRQLEIFLVLAQKLHFRHAAEHLHISQPPLSRRIMELEEELGTKLFERTTRGVRLTPAGEILKEEANRLLQHSDLVRQRITSLPAPDCRKIHIGIVGSATYDFFPDLVEVLGHSGSGLSFEVSELGSSEQIKALAAGILDLGFLRSWAITPDIDFEPLMDETLAFIYPEDMRHAGGAEPELSDLAPFPYIAFSDTCAPMLQRLADSICHRSGFTPRKRLVVDNYGAALRYVERGLGWSIVPTQTLSQARHALQHRVLRGIPEKITLGLASRREESDLTLRYLITQTKDFFHLPTRDMPAR